MSETDRPTPARTPSPQVNATVGLAIVVVAAVLGIVMLVKGGGDTQQANVVGGGGSPSSTLPSLSPSGSTGATGPTTQPKASLNVVVGNGSNKNGRGTTVKDYLVSQGYTAATAKTAKVQATSVVYYATSPSGLDADAKAIAQVVGLTEGDVKAVPADFTFENSETIGSAKVVVILGKDYDPASKLPTSGGTTGATGSSGSTGATASSTTTTAKN